VLIPQRCCCCCRFIPLLGELLDCPHSGLRCAATDVLIEVVCKRMEPTAKINLVQQLQVVEACERLSTNLVMAAAAGANKAAGGAAGGGRGQGGPASPGPAAGAQQLAQHEEVLTKYAKLLATLAGEVMDALKRIENGEWGRMMNARMLVSTLVAFTGGLALGKLQGCTWHAWCVDPHS
jgi:hypothetical protein